MVCLSSGAEIVASGIAVGRSSSPANRDACLYVERDSLASSATEGGVSEWSNDAIQVIAIVVGGPSSKAPDSNSRRPTTQDAEECRKLVDASDWDDESNCSK